MKQTYWDIIEKSKRGCNFNSDAQFDNLFNLLKDRDKKFIQDFEREWCLEQGKYIGGECEEFNKLHISNGGIVDTGDDGFYMDFGNWLFTQGKELWQSFIEKGHKVVIDYIVENDIQEEEYTYECMAYVFSALAKYKGYKYV